MTVGDRLRINLDRALVQHRAKGGPKLTIATLAPRCNLSRLTLAGLGAHTKINSLRLIAGVLGCSVADLVEDVEPIRPIGEVLADDDRPAPD